MTSNIHEAGDWELDYDDDRTIVMVFPPYYGACVSPQELVDALEKAFYWMAPNPEGTEAEFQEYESDLLAVQRVIAKARGES